MTDHAPFVINLNDDGPHIAHRFPTHEECNADQFDKRIYLDQIEVDELITGGKAERCKHCFNEDER